MKKFVPTLATLIIIFLLIFNIFTIFNLPVFGYRVYKVISGSMAPYLQINDLVIVKETDDYQVGDIVTYKDDANCAVTHRIVSIDDNQIITKGDANNANDSPISKDDIVGKLVFKIGLPGFVSYILLQPVSWVLILIMGVILVFLIPKN